MGKKLSKFNENFIKKCDKNNNTGYFLEVDIEHLKTLFNSHITTQKKKGWKVEKLIFNIEDKEKYVIHIRATKQALNHELNLKKVHRVIQFNQKAWLKLYIDINN